MGTLSAFCCRTSSFSPSLLRENKKASNGDYPAKLLACFALSEAISIFNCLPSLKDIWQSVNSGIVILQLEIVAKNLND
jgi:hypothetical protein